MSENLSLQDWMEQGKALLPITGVVHVGAGGIQTVSHYANWGVSTAVLVEAEEDLHSKLAAFAQQHAGWSVQLALLSDHEGEMDFYLASNPRESGVLPPSSLTGLWKNLKTREQRPLQATTLDHLLAGATPSPETINWAVIDCFPALPVLQGAGRYLDLWDVVITRVVLDNSKSPGLGTTKTEIDSFLATHGYRCLAWEEERQPAIGRVLYIRDWKGLLGSRLKEVQERLSRQTGEQQAQIEQLTKARDEQEILKQELIEARQTVSLSIKLQTLREADLKDLQGRYQTSLSIQERQHQMLVKLGERLSVASSYFHQLVDAQAAPLPNVEEESKVKAKLQAKPRAKLKTVPKTKKTQFAGKLSAKPKGRARS